MLQNKITLSRTFTFFCMMRNRSPFKKNYKDIITYSIVIILKSDLYNEIQGGSNNSEHLKNLYKYSKYIYIYVYIYTIHNLPLNVHCIDCKIAELLRWYFTLYVRGEVYARYNGTVLFQFQATTTPGVTFTAGGSGNV